MFVFLIAIVIDLSVVSNNLPLASANIIAGPITVGTPIFLSKLICTPSTNSVLSSLNVGLIAVPSATTSVQFGIVFSNVVDVPAIIACVPDAKVGYVAVPFTTIVLEDDVSPVKSTLHFHSCPWYLTLSPS